MDKIYTQLGRHVLNRPNYLIRCYHKYMYVIDIVNASPIPIIMKALRRHTTSAMLSSRSFQKLNCSLITITIIIISLFRGSEKLHHFEAARSSNRVWGRKNGSSGLKCCSFWPSVKFRGTHLSDVWTENKYRSDAGIIDTNSTKIRPANAEIWLSEIKQMNNDSKT